MAPGPPALISVTMPKPSPVQDMVVVEARPISESLEKCRSSSWMWPAGTLVNCSSGHAAALGTHLGQPPLVVGHGMLIALVHGGGHDRVASLGTRHVGSTMGHATKKTLCERPSEQVPATWSPPWSILNVAIGLSRGLIALLERGRTWPFALWTVDTMVGHQSRWAAISGGMAGTRYGSCA